VILVSMAATAINNVNLCMAIQHEYKSTVEVLVKAADAKDPYAAGHSRRVKEFALMAADALGLSPDEMRTIEFGAMLHDIGKIGISDSILNRPGPLTTEEWYIMRKHALKGANIVSEIPSLEKARGIVLYHHERYDGKGYPEGLKGDEIPIGARLCAVADAFDTMVTEHSYRAALSLDEAMHELIKGSGTQFCPVAVNAFVSGFQKHKGKLPKMQDAAAPAKEAEKAEITGEPEKPAVEEAERKAREQAERAAGGARMPEKPAWLSKKEFEREAKEQAKRAAEEARIGKKAEKLAKKEIEREDKELTKRLAEEARTARHRAKEEAERAAEETRITRQMAKKEAEREAEEMAERAAEEIRIAKQLTREAMERESEEVERAAEARNGVPESSPEIGEFHEGNIELVIKSSVDFRQVNQFQKHLNAVDGLKIVMYGWSEDEGNTIAVSAQKPMDLVEIISEIPIVEKVYKSDTNIVIALKT